MKTDAYYPSDVYCASDAYHPNRSTHIIVNKCPFCGHLGDSKPTAWQWGQEPFFDLHFEPTVFGFVERLEKPGVYNRKCVICRQTTTVVIAPRLRGKELREFGMFLLRGELSKDQLDQR